MKSEYLEFWNNLQGDLGCTKSFGYKVWNARQAEIEKLKVEKAGVQKRFNFLLDKNICNESDHASLKLKFMEINRLVKSLRSEFDLNDCCPQVERQIELLEQALQGEDHDSV